MEKEDYTIPKLNYKTIDTDNDLDASFGRTIIKNLDGTVIVEPKAPESVLIGNCWHFLSDLGKERWNKGLSISYFDCFNGIIVNKNILKVDFE